MSSLGNDLKNGAEQSKKKEKGLNIQVEMSDKAKQKATTAQNLAAEIKNPSKKPVTI